MSAQKQLWMLVGGNGAGKSTFYKLYLEPLGLPFINADLIARAEYPDDPEGHSYDAAKIAEELRAQLLINGTSFCFETVYSHPSKIDFVAQAKALGYEVIMVFIHLDIVELNQARISQRISEGGHSVPAEKVESRIPRTLQHVKTSLPLCDKVHVLDNSSAGTPFSRLLTINEGEVEVFVDSLPEWAMELIADYEF